MSLLFRLRALWRATPPELVEALTGLIALLFGAILLVSPQLFARGPAYRVMAVAPEWGWGLVAVGIGVAQIVGALHLPAARLREPAATAAFLLWFFVATGLAAVGLTTGLAVYPVLDGVLLAILARHRAAHPPRRGRKAVPHAD